MDVATDFERETAKRREKGKALFEAGKVTQLQNHDFYWVESARSKDGGYVVDILNKRCECEDYERRGLPCKHYYASFYESVELIKKMVKEAVGKVIL